MEILCLLIFTPNTAPSTKDHRRPKITPATFLDLRILLEDYHPNNIHPILILSRLNNSRHLRRQQNRDHLRHWHRRAIFRQVEEVDNITHRLLPPRIIPANAVARTMLLRKGRLPPSIPMNRKI